MVTFLRRAQLQRSRLLATLAATTLVGAVLFLPAIRSEADSFSYSITVTPADALTDGQGFTVTVTGPPGTTVLNSGFCDPSMPQPTSERDLTEWCTDTIGNGAAGGLAPSDESGVAELTIRAGVGAATKTAPALGTEHDWVCDITSPCKLPLVITPPHGDATYDISTELTYRDADPTAGCGSTAADAVASSAPDRLTEQWVAWTVGDCADRGRATTASFENDGRALDEFTRGDVDLAYSGVAPGTAGFGAGTRPAVATPVALNATVLAVAGFYPATTSVPGTRLWRHIDDVKISQAEVTALLSGHLSLDEELQASLVARNPQLKVQANAVGFTAPSTLAGPQATTWFTSNRLAARAGAGWSYPNSKSKYDEHAGQPLGAFADYNTVYNSLAMANLSTGKPQLVGEIYKKLAEKPESSISLVTFYLTDLATARQLRLAPAAIDDGSGTFVAPTPEALAAAAPALVTDAAGFASPPTGAVPAGAYPLTFVEYALSPSERLLDADCEERPTELAALTRWLTYVTGAGQDPARLSGSGMVSLTPALRDRASASIASIGASAPTTGPCAPSTPTTTTPTTTTTTTPGGTAPSGSVDGGFPGGNVPLGDVPGGGGGPGGDLDPSGDLPAGAAGVTRRRSSDQNSIGEATQVALATKIPRLPGPGGSPVLLGLLAIPFLVALTSATGWLSTGRPAPSARRRGAGR